MQHPPTPSHTFPHFPMPLPFHPHRTGEPLAQDGPSPLPSDILRVYIAQAKQYEPNVPADLTGALGVPSLLVPCLFAAFSLLNTLSLLACAGGGAHYASLSTHTHTHTHTHTRTDYVAAIYAEMRQLEKSQMELTSTYTTPRTLLSILRVSMALAKLRFDTTVSAEGVWERAKWVEKGSVEQRRLSSPSVLSICHSALPLSFYALSLELRVILIPSHPHPLLSPTSSPLTHILSPSHPTRARTQVIQSDVDEALRLMRMSKSSLASDIEPQRKEDNISICYK
jgi:hypothetical protein